MEKGSKDNPWPSSRPELPPLKIPERTVTPYAHRGQETTFRSVPPGPTIAPYPEGHPDFQALRAPAYPIYPGMPETASSLERRHRAQGFPSGGLGSTFHNPSDLGNAAGYPPAQPTTSPIREAFASPSRSYGYERPRFATRDGNEASSSPSSIYSPWYSEASSPTVASTSSISPTSPRLDRSRTYSMNTHSGHFSTMYLATDAGWTTHNGSQTFFAGVGASPSSPIAPMPESFGLVGNSRTFASLPSEEIDNSAIPRSSFRSHSLHGLHIHGQWNAGNPSLGAPSARPHATAALPFGYTNATPDHKFCHYCRLHHTTQRRYAKFETELHGFGLCSSCGDWEYRFFDKLRGVWKISDARFRVLLAKRQAQKARGGSVRRFSRKLADHMSMS